MQVRTNTLIRTVCLLDCLADDFLLGFVGEEAFQGDPRIHANASSTHLLLLLFLSLLLPLFLLSISLLLSLDNVFFSLGVSKRRWLIFGVREKRT